MGIGKKIEDNTRLQHFVEVCLSHVFDMVVNEDYDLIENICENADITQDEMFWMFEQLGYDRSVYVDENTEDTELF
jgi:hypothetical protein